MGRAVVEPTELLGTWHLERRIVDRRDHRFGRVTGSLTLDATGDGEVTWAGRDLPVFRNLRIVRGPAGWTVCFDDGDEFHPWRPGTALVHPCRADSYHGIVDVDVERGVLRVLWDVTGPAKDTRLFTRCTRNRDQREVAGARG
jgi:hypothetical protein